MHISVNVVREVHISVHVVREVHISVNVVREVHISVNVVREVHISVNVVREVHISVHVVREVHISVKCNWALPLSDIRRSQEQYSPRTLSRPTRQGAGPSSGPWPCPRHPIVDAGGWWAAPGVTPGSRSTSGGSSGPAGSS